MFALLSSGTEAASFSLADVLAGATTMVNWFVTAMGSFLGFITSNPIVLVMFMILLAGSAVGMLLRIWHSA